MEARTTRRPGQRGTRQLLARFGDRLLFVRYRYDESARRRYKTVELIVDEQPWIPPRKSASRAPIRQGPGAQVGVRVDMHESGVQKRVKAAGGRWDRMRRLWLLPADHAHNLGLDERIVAL